MLHYAHALLLAIFCPLADLFGEVGLGRQALRILNEIMPFMLFRPRMIISKFSTFLILSFRWRKFGLSLPHGFHDRRGKRYVFKGATAQVAPCFSALRSATHLAAV